MKIGQKIKYAREKMGWDIVDLATYAGLRIERAGEIDDGIDEPKMSELTKIAAALKRTVEWFMSEDEPDDPPMLYCKLSETSGMSE
jgi:transcriptional regulator with XRE-family HTH domain